MTLDTDDDDARALFEEVKTERVSESTWQMPVDL